MEEEWQSVAEAYYEDEATGHSVKVSNFCRCVCDKGEGVSSKIQMKVAPCIGRRCFSISPKRVETRTDIRSEAAVEGALGR